MGNGGGVLCRRVYVGLYVWDLVVGGGLSNRHLGKGWGGLVVVVICVMIGDSSHYQNLIMRRECDRRRRCVLLTGEQVGEEELN